MANTIKIRARMKGDLCETKCLIEHIMETGTRKDAKTGEIIPAHYISEVNCEHNGVVVMHANWGPAISKNPYLAFRFKGAAVGDTVKVSWVDNAGATDMAEAVIK